MIKIKDNGEKLVDISRICPGIAYKLSCEKLYNRKPLVRETVAKMLNKAKSYLPKGMTFIVNDAWRSQKMQKKVFNNRYRRMKKQYPDWPEEKILKETKLYVAPFKGKHVSGHMFGGAIDLRLYRDGRKVPLRSWQITYQENAKPDQTNLPKYFQENRKIMFKALKKAGFIQAPHEYWHWSYGDVWWAEATKNNSTLYGPVFKL